MTRLPCCATWDANPVIAESPLMRAVADAYPVTDGHALIVPKRHVTRFVDLNTDEILETFDLIEGVVRAIVEDADDFTIAVNDGPLAGRTIPHLHIHVIPRRAGDVPDPRGGVRQLLVPVGRDPWINRKDTA